MSRIRDIANILSTSTSMATDAEVTAAVSSHTSATTGIHGVTGAVVGTTDTQTLSNKILLAPEERWTVSATAATGTIQFDCLTQGVLYYTANSSNNWTINFRGNSGTTLNSILNTGDAITVNFLATNSTAYYQSTPITVDTNATVTIRWSGGTTPAAGNASSIDAYSYTIVKTGASTFTVLCAGPVKYA